jgi:polygalacturonase
VPNLVLENIDVSGTETVVSSKRKKSILKGPHVELWATGRRYTAQNISGTSETSYLERWKPVEGLQQNGKYFSQSKPQYEKEPLDNFVSVLQYGVKGDGKPTLGNAENFNKALKDAAARGKILVIPAGSYIVEKTLEIPLNSRIAGILYPQIVAFGDYFSDPKQPKAVLEVGKENSRGLIHMSDLIITNRGATAGAIFVQWNVHQKSPGSAAMWDCIVRVGGAAGTDITNSNCQKHGKQEAKKSATPRL